MAHQMLYCPCSSVRLLISPWLFSLSLSFLPSLFALASCPAFHVAPRPFRLPCKQCRSDNTCTHLSIFKSKYATDAARLVTVVTQRLQLESPGIVVVISFFDGRLASQGLSLDYYLTQVMMLIKQQVPARKTRSRGFQLLLQSRHGTTYVL